MTVGASAFLVLASAHLQFRFIVLRGNTASEINGMPFSNIQVELLQTEDVLTNPTTVWDDPGTAGAHFCTFLEREISAKMEREEECKGGTRMRITGLEKYRNRESAQQD